jgi:hypothetical protein
MPKATTKATKVKKTGRVRAYTVRYNDTEDGFVRRAADEAALEVGSWIRMVSVRVAREQELKKKYTP